MSCRSRPGPRGGHYGPACALTGSKPRQETVRRASAAEQGNPSPLLCVCGCSPSVRGRGATTCASAKLRRLRNTLAKKKTVADSLSPCPTRQTARATARAPRPRCPQPRSRPRSPVTCPRHRSLPEPTVTGSCLLLLILPPSLPHAHFQA